MKVINIFAGPGAGKSRLAKDLYLKMSDAGFNVVIRAEVAEDLLYEQRASVLTSNQLYVMAGQYERVHSLLDQGFDYAIIDSPVLLSSVYNRRTMNPVCPENFDVIALDLFSRFENINFFLERNHEAFPFRQSGRIHDEKESRVIDQQILKMLEHMNIFMPIIKNGKDVGDRAFELILELEGLSVTPEEDVLKA